MAALIWGFACAAHADDPAVMEWMVLDLPPASIPVDGKLTDGYVDAILKMVFAEWPEVEHRIVVTPATRAMAMLTEGAQKCFATALLTPERERVAYFTVTVLMAPMQLVARADVINRLPFNDKGEVLPAALFDRPDLRGLVVPRRSYSPMLDALLNLRSPKSGVVSAVSADAGSNVLKMLSLNRADYTLEYDFVLAYQQARNPDLINDKSLKSLPIAGTTPILGGIACPRTEWGRTTVLKIDAILAKIAQRPEYRDAHNRWFTTDGIKRYKALQAEFFKQRAKPTDPAKYALPPAVN